MHHASTTCMPRTSRARVLIVEDVPMEARLLMRALADAGYSNLAHRSDAESALAEMQANPPRLVITDLDLAGAKRTQPTEAVRTLDKTAAVYVLMLTASRYDAVLGRCFDPRPDEDTDDAVSPARALLPEEPRMDLATNLGARTRVLPVAPAGEDVALASAPTIEASPASRAAPLDALQVTPTWRDVESVLTKAMSDFFQLPFSAVEIVDDKGDAFVAEVSLAETSRQLELGLSVVVETESMKRLGAHLLGDEDLEGAEALVLEVANIMMGTLKTAFSAHGFMFTGGLPTSEKLADSRLTLNRAAVRMRMAIAAGDSEVELWLRANEKRNTKVLGQALKEGMVVGEDVLNAEGTLLIKAGSRLTQTTAERLAALVPDVEICVSVPTAKP